MYIIHYMYHNIYHFLEVNNIVYFKKFAFLISNTWITIKNSLVYLPTIFSFFQKIGLTAYKVIFFHFIEI